VRAVRGAYYAQDDPDEGIEANTEGWICEVSRPLIYPDCQSLDDRIDFVRRRTEMWAQTTERARQQMDPEMRERIESAVQDEQEEIAAPAGDRGPQSEPRPARGADRRRVIATAAGSGEAATTTRLAVVVIGGALFLIVASRER